MIKFGTGGWRALIGEEFTKENVMLVTQAVCNDMKANGWDTIVVGKDRRFLSDKSAIWISCVAAGNKIKVKLIDKYSPTPLIMFAVKELKTQYGIAVTASHNPAEYNGLKLFVKGGRDANEIATNKIENIIERIDEKEIKYLDYEKALESKLIELINPFNNYVDQILNSLDVEAIRGRGLKVILDPMYGVSKTCLQTILMTARCDVDVIHDRHDTLFGGRLPSPESSTLQSLKQLVKEKKYDIGIGTDGDADRLGVIDEKGNFIHPNQLFALIYYYLLEYKGWRGNAVRNIATTHMIDKIAESYDQKCIEVPVGFKYISAMMKEKDALIGGESSGGICIKGHIDGKDGIYAAGLLVEMICVTKKGLCELMKDLYEKYGNYSVCERSMKFDISRKEEIINRSKRIAEKFNLEEIEKISNMDGTKLYFNNGDWLSIRFSGTEPLIRFFSEAKSPEQANKLVAKAEEYIMGTDIV